MQLLVELKRRNVIRMAGLYLVAAWLLTQVASTVLPMFGAPEWLPRSVVILLALGFIPTLIFAWVFELTPEGLRREGAGRAGNPLAPQTARRLQYSLAAVLAIAIVYYFTIDRFVLRKAARDVPASAAQVASSPAAGSNSSIAVLPFENLSADPDNAYFASGMQEMVLTKLADIASLKVVSRTSTQKYKSHPDDLKTIAQQLGVATVLEGSVQKAGNSVLISVKLIDANTDSHIWAEAYARTLDNVFDIEGDVAQKVAEALEARLSPTEQQTLSKPPTRNAEAYDLYLQGGYFLLQIEGANADPAVAVSKALELYTQATRKDPTFAQAYARMAYARALLYWYQIEVDQADIDEAARLADRALALDPASAEAHVAKGYVVYWGRRDYAKALAEFAEAQRLQPNVPGIVAANAYIFRRQGNWQAALDAFTHAVALDPRNPQWPSDMAFTLASARRYTEASAAADRCLALNAAFWDARSAKALIAVFANGDTAGASAGLARLDEAAGPRGSVTYVRYELAMWSRDFEAALAVLDGAPKRIHTNPGHELIPVDLLRAQALEALGRTQSANAAFESTILTLEREAKEQPADISAHAFLGRAYAGVERKDDAVREAHRAVELLTIEHDAFAGPSYLENLAKVHARLGNAADAAELIRHLLSMPAGLTLSLPLLKIDPAWDPIRKDARFQQLLTESNNATGAKP